MGQTKKTKVLLWSVFTHVATASMQIYWTKRKHLDKRAKRQQDYFRTPTRAPFHCFGTPIWPPWRHFENALLVQNLTFVSLESKRLRKLLCRKNIAADPVDETDTVLVAKRCGWTLTWSEATSYLASGSFTFPFRLRSFTQAKIIPQTMSTNTILETT